jgi:N-acetylglucosaminyldiphosphoundecaprenol N-acetyl-beta-D-mannosaminyltransferase
MVQAIQHIDAWIQSHQRQYVCVANVHLVMECQRDRLLRQICNRAGMVTPDGMPLVWLNHRKGFTTSGRVYGPDLLLAVCEASLSKGYRHYFYGGEMGVAEQLAQNLRQRFPGLQVVGTYTPPFRDLGSAEEQEIIDHINRAQPDIVWVGLGAPKQEHWMSHFRERLDAPVLIGVGVAFDYHAGRKKQAPPWMQERGLEWAFRLYHEPHRLWRRYFPNNLFFLILVLLQELGLRQYSLDG